MTSGWTAEEPCRVLTGGGGREKYRSSGMSEGVYQ